MQANPHAVRLNCDGVAAIGRKHPISRCQEKPLASTEVPVPQTDTGR